MNFIEELYYGNICPHAKAFTRDSHYAKVIEIVAKNEEFLNKALESEEKKRFLELMNAQGEIVSITALESFIDGFKMGSGFMLDTFFVEYKSVLKDIY